MNCPKCGIDITPGVDTCPKCNTPIKFETIDDSKTSVSPFSLVPPSKREVIVNTNPTPTDAPNHKSVGFVLGFSKGIPIFLILAILAAYAVMSGYHHEYAFTAIAVAAPVIAGFWGMKMFRQGKCPHCDKFINGFLINNKTIQCKSCKKSVLYKDNQFTPV